METKDSLIIKSYASLDFPVCRGYILNTSLNYKSALIVPSTIYIFYSFSDISIPGEKFSLEA